ncbi:thiol reductase thioredoxin [Capnocytophaga canis]|uniref:Thiol reductase thioredoxin n=1 Tax=Capnocytophaga canis TaxID=1848903 RepID=A0A3A1YG17_9FLAO|nr:thioredoxin family protein [Capnocytophaga canis]RIY37203.1 thiol reductase thioredoxin [Capnocytophaga canis]
MDKFGNIVDVNVPVLFCFYADWHETSVQMNGVLKEIVTQLGNKVKVVKIDVDKNKELTKALKINGLPTIVIFNQRELVWRGEDFHSSNLLITELVKYLQ